jgi:hypothetical protein
MSMTRRDFFAALTGSSCVRCEGVRCDRCGDRVSFLIRVQVYDVAPQWGESREVGFREWCYLCVSNAGSRVPRPRA